jgi:hypothetical protein
MRGLGLGRKVSEEIFSVVTFATAVRQAKKRVVRARRGPGNLNRVPGAGNVKQDAVLRAGQGKAGSAEVEDNWTANRLYLIVVGIARAASPVTATALEEKCEAGESARKAGNASMRGVQRDCREAPRRWRAKRAQSATEN